MKKKLITNKLSKKWQFTKLLRVMKIATLFLIACTLNIHASVYSQNKFSYDFRGKTVREIFQVLEKDSEFRFFYNDNFNYIDQKLNVIVKDQNVEGILSQLFSSSEMTYRILDNKLVVLTPVEIKQMVTVKGKITDAQGVGLPGVNIIVKGSTTGTTSDAEGNYSIQVSDANAVLVFSYIGFTTQEVPLQGRNSLNVSLKEDVQNLQEVVVIGYGTLEKRAVTTSVTSISSKAMLQGLGGATVATAMQGKVSGLTISGTASPNSSNDFQLRGVASVNAGQGPLVVIDGIPGGDLRMLNQEDIQSIDVLKDASAGAIYGTRAAGGVILITTKRAKEGPVQVTYTGEFSTEQIRRRPEMLSAEEFVANKLGEDYGYNTDWYDVVTNKNPFSQRHVLSLSGGTKTSRIYTTFSAQDQKGISIGDNRTDYSGRMNADFNLMDGFVELMTHADFRVADRDQRSGGGTYNMAMKLNPTQTPYDESQPHGYNVWTGGWEYYNPLADIMLQQNNGKDKWLLADATLKFNLFPFLSTQGTIGYQGREWQQYRYVSSQHKASLDNSRTGEGYQGFSKNDDIVFEWLANFNKTFGKHDIKAVGGYSFQEFNGESFNMTNYNFPVDGVGPWDIGKGTYLSEGRASMNSYKNPRQRLIAFLGRVNYTFNNKYLFTASIRREGSSKFGAKNKWGTFPAVSAGWRISEEPFMDNLSFINDLKLRAGYGVTGNNDFAAGKSTRMYASDTWWLADGKWMYTYGSKHNVNDELQWEEKSEINVGLDYSLLKNRIFGKFDIYKRHVNGMIYDIEVSVPPAVHNKTTMNVGDLENRGWEFELGVVPVQTTEWNYTTTFRFSHNVTDLVSLWGSQTYQNRVGFPAPGSPGDAGRLEAGTTIGQFYLWRFAGFTNEGQWMLYDKDGNAFDVTQRPKTLDDKSYVGNAIPKLIVSWEHNLQWKNFDFAMIMRSWIGHDVFNTINMYYGLPTVKEQNVLKDAFDKNKNVKGEKQLSDYWLEDGTFLKIDAITIGYNLSPN
jgi:TonB-linked SusC/RagA family outer membrane protein